MKPPTYYALMDNKLTGPYHSMPEALASKPDLIYLNGLNVVWRRPASTPEGRQKLAALLALIRPTVEAEEAPEGPDMALPENVILALHLSPSKPEEYFPNDFKELRF